MRHDYLWFECLFLISLSVWEISAGKVHGAQRHYWEVKNLTFSLLLYHIPSQHLTYPFSTKAVWVLVRSQSLVSNLISFLAFDPQSTSSEQWNWFVSSTKTQNIAGLEVRIACIGVPVTNKMNRNSFKHQYILFTVTVIIYRQRRCEGACYMLRITRPFTLIFYVNELFSTSLVVVFL